jgi:pilus assembly protein Flp/PilA
LRATLSISQKIVARGTAGRSRPPQFRPAYFFIEGEELEMFVTLMKLWKNEDGATAIEYGLIAALIAVAAITAFQLVGTNLTSTFNNVASKL